jgi:threonylcarbamoyladenosine tRNA methylthiotransferase MtaB
MKTKTIAIKSIGCRTNQEEMASLGSKLREEGYSLVKNTSDADIIIVNTCSVTGHTESKTKRLIKSYVKKYSGAKIMVTGCLAQQVPEELMQTGGISWVVGNAYKKDIPGILSSKKGGLYYSELTREKTPVAVFNNYPIIPDDEWRTRFPVKIQEGCDFQCSYCIVPLLRGPSRSVSSSDIVNMCKQAFKAGYKEAVLTGTHIGQYSEGKKYGIIDLIDDILALGKDFRLRLSTLDPRDCNEDILQRIEGNEQICKHIHINVQSFSPDVLAGMNRHYREYDLLIKRLISFRKKYPYAGIGGDFIVGFPGETESMFETTLETVREVGFNYGHVFRYSKRPGTAAASMNNQVSEKEKTERSNQLRKCLVKMRQEFIDKQLNTVTHTIVVEQEKPIRGITSNYIRVEVPRTHAARNSWQKVILKTYVPEKNYCEAVLPNKEM